MPFSGFQKRQDYCTFEGRVNNAGYHGVSKGWGLMVPRVYFIMSKEQVEVFKEE